MLVEEGRREDAEEEADDDGADEHQQHQAQRWASPDVARAVGDVGQDAASLGRFLAGLLTGSLGVAMASAIGHHGDREHADGDQRAHDDVGAAGAGGGLEQYGGDEGREGLAQGVRELAQHHRVADQPGTDEVGGEGVARWSHHHEGESEPQHQHEHQRQRHLAEQEQDTGDRQHHGAAALTEDNDPLAVHAVGDHPAERRQQHGEPDAGADHADRGVGPGQVVGDDRHRQEHHHVGERGEERADEEDAEVAVAQRGEGILTPGLEGGDTSCHANSL